MKEGDKEVRSERKGGGERGREKRERGRERGAGCLVVTVLDFPPLPPKSRMPEFVFSPVVT